MAAPGLDRLTPSLAWLRRGLLIAFSALAAWLAVRLVLALMSPQSLWEPVDLPVPVAAAGPAADTEYDFTFNPFAAGDAEAATEPVEQPLNADAPETTLNLTLKGLRAGQNGSAFIRRPDGDEDNYYVDDQLLDRVFLRGVFPDHVLIEVNGEIQRLTTEEAKQAQRNARFDAPARPQNDPYRSVRPVDAQSLLRQVNIIPYLDSDQQRVGVRISPRSGGIDLTDYGLRADDIITTFAGQSLTTGLPDLVALRRRVTAGQPVSVSLIRDGQPMTITIGASS